MFVTSSIAVWLCLHLPRLVLRVLVCRSLLRVILLLFVHLEGLRHSDVTASAEL